MLDVVLPALGTAYALFVAMVVVAVRRPAPRPSRDERTSTGSALWTAIGGYAVFLVIVAVFHVWLAEESGALGDALWGGAFLALVAFALGGTVRVVGRSRR